MQVQELRIGSAVMCECRWEYKPHTVKSIWYNDEEKLYYVELDNGFQCNVGGISPITITDELLEKNGFELTDKPIVKTDLRIQQHFVYRKTIDNVIIDVDHVQVFVSQTGTANIVNIRDLKHIHQLQNSYYLLTGKELEITL